MNENLICIRLTSQINRKMMPSSTNDAGTIHCVFRILACIGSKYKKFLLFYFDTWSHYFAHLKLVILLSQPTK